MAGIRGPKNKLSRREGKDLFGTGGASLERRIGQPPGVHGKKPKPQQQSEMHASCVKSKKSSACTSCVRSSSGGSSVSHLVRAV